MGLIRPGQRLFCGSRILGGRNSGALSDDQGAVGGCTRAQSDNSTES